MKKILLVSVLFVFVGFGCARKEWTAFYYPDVTNMDSYIHSAGGEVKSLEECRAWINRQSARINPNKLKDDDYECGYGCRFEDPYGLFVCNELME